MTTEEAVNELLGLKDSLDGLPPETVVIETFDVLNMAIKALEEIQQYRAIGTVEECREAMAKQKPKKPLGGIFAEMNIKYAGSVRRL